MGVAGPPRVGVVSKAAGPSSQLWPEPAAAVEDMFGTSVGGGASTDELKDVSLDGNTQRQWVRVNIRIYSTLLSVNDS